ncbi:MAG: metallophosphoesterase [Waddliaceae bacterium]
MENNQRNKTPSVWAIADLHLSFGVPDKEMDIFGEEWEGWTEKIADNWKANISSEDLVLIPGDISWAMHIEQVIPDLEWIGSLPGTKVILRGNHDYWWSSKSKIKRILPPTVYMVQNDAFQWENISVAGARLWDTPEFHFLHCIIFKENKCANPLADNEYDVDTMEKIFQRELGRLELSLKELNQVADYRIAMTHYPPISADLKESRASKLLKKYNVDICVFGHLHSLKPGSLSFGEKEGIQYHLTSCDHLNFVPLKVL